MDSDNENDAGNELEADYNEGPEDIPIKLGKTQLPNFINDEDEDFPFDMSHKEEGNVLNAIKEDRTVHRKTRLDFWINAVTKRIEEVKKPVRRFALAVSGLCMLQLYDVIDEMTSDEFKETHVKDRTMELHHLLEDLLNNMKMATTFEEAATKAGILKSFLNAIEKFTFSAAFKRKGTSTFHWSPPKDSSIKMKIGPKADNTKSKSSPYRARKIDTINKTKNTGVRKPADKALLKKETQVDGPDRTDFDGFIEGLKIDVLGALQWMDNLDADMINDSDPNDSSESFAFVSSFICLNDTFLGLANVAMFDINQKYKKRFTLHGLMLSDEVYIAFAKYVAFLYRQSVNNRAYTDVNNTSAGHSYHRSTTLVYGKTRFQLNSENQDRIEMLEFFSTVIEKETWEVIPPNKRSILPGSSKVNVNSLGDAKSKYKLKKVVLVKT
jgi:hypothetical protein